MRDFGLTGALLREGSRETVGLTYAKLREFASHADLLVNISGLLTDPALTEGIPIRVYLDLDPAFVQLWNAQGIDMRFAGHTHFATVGQAIGASDCSVPTGGVPWIATLPPVVLEEWPIAERLMYDAFTTIAH